MTDNTYEVPYWVDSHVEVKELSIGEIPASMFNNSTEYRLRLVGLSFAGPITSTTPTVTTLPTRHPGWASNLLVDIGKSGCSDQNLVRSSLTNLCGTPRIQRQKWGANNMGRSYWLPKPYKLDQDEGLRVEVQARWPGYEHTGMTFIAKGYDSAGYEYTGRERIGSIPRMTFIAKGYDSDGYPVQLAALNFVSNLDPGGAALVMDSADLFNRGRKPIYLTEFCYKGMDTVVIGYDKETGISTYGWDGDGCQIGWRINPSNPSFTQMMPNATTIPVGLLTPLDRCYDGGSESPLCYWFPQNTYLDPKQALAVRFSSEDESSELDVWVCMFGQLEVM